MSEMSPLSLLDLLGSERGGDSRPGLGVGRGAAPAYGSGNRTNQRNNKVKRERGEREHQKRRALCAAPLTRTPHRNILGDCCVAGVTFDQQHMSDLSHLIFFVV